MTETLSIYTCIQGYRQFETSYTGAVAFLVIVVLTVVVNDMRPRDRNLAMVFRNYALYP